MARVEPIQPDDLTPDGRAIFDEIAGPREGTVNGPFLVWLRSDPELTRRLNRVSDVLRVNGTLDKRFFEIAVLCIARQWESNYQWSVHSRFAQQAGLSEDAIESIRTGREPQFDADDERVVYQAMAELTAEKTISAPNYDALLALLGFEQVAELVTTAAWYGMAGTVTNAFEIEPPSGKQYFVN